MSDQSSTASTWAKSDELHRETPIPTSSLFSASSSIAFVFISNEKNALNILLFSRDIAYGIFKRGFPLATH